MPLIAITKGRHRLDATFQYVPYTHRDKTTKVRQGTKSLCIDQMRFSIEIIFRNVLSDGFGIHTNYIEILSIRTK